MTLIYPIRVKKNSINSENLISEILGYFNQMHNFKNTQLKKNYKYNINCIMQKTHNFKIQRHDKIIITIIIIWPKHNSDAI